MDIPHNNPFNPSSKTLISDTVDALCQWDQLQDLPPTERLSAAHHMLNVCFMLMNNYPIEMFSEIEQEIVTEAYRNSVIILAEIFIEEEEISENYSENYQVDDYTNFNDWIDRD